MQHQFIQTSCFTTLWSRSCTQPVATFSPGPGKSWQHLRSAGIPQEQQAKAWLPGQSTCSHWRSPTSWEHLSSRICHLPCHSKQAGEQQKERAQVQHCLTAPMRAAQVFTQRLSEQGAEIIYNAELCTPLRTHSQLYVSNCSSLNESLKYTWGVPPFCQAVVLNQTLPAHNMLKLK